MRTRRSIEHESKAFLTVGRLFSALALFVMLGGSAYSVYSCTDKAENPPILQTEDRIEQQKAAPSVEDLVIEDTDIGEGECAEQGDQVTISWEAFFLDGMLFDSSLLNGGPSTFVIGDGTVIDGWDQGVEGMSLGGERTLIVPPHLAYGREGLIPQVPAGASIKYKVELIGLKKDVGLEVEEL